MSHLNSRAADSSARPLAFTAVSTTTRSALSISENQHNDSGLAATISSAASLSARILAEAHFTATGELRAAATTTSNESHSSASTYSNTLPDKRTARKTSGLRARRRSDANLNAAGSCAIASSTMPRASRSAGDANPNTRPQLAAARRTTSGLPRNRSAMCSRWCPALRTASITLKKSSSFRISCSVATRTPPRMDAIVLVPSSCTSEPCSNSRGQHCKPC
mmetsp:Transcript_32071/g.67778  ORF Transcript_32071/g.67778 Transcript_32071/m.67778 type:complete len:221 (-) Transcript_32071:279-941(-)